jgi:uncharacterized RDD family membrane protein YckC
MNEPPLGPELDTTRTIPVTPAPPGASAVSRPPAFVHRFGSVPFYVLARFLAFAIDGFAMAFVIAAFALNAFEPGGVSILSRRDEGAFGALALIAFGGAFALAFVCEGLFGTTLGKSVFALHVRRADGRHAGVGRVFVRALLRPIDLLLIGPILAFVTPRHQRLGDFAGGTVVSRSPIGPLASVIALALLGGLAYAEIVLGGGATSAIGVSGEAAAFGPDYASKASALVGLALPNVTLPGVPAAASASPSPSPGAAVERSAAPAVEPSVAETAEPDAPATDAPGETTGD